MKCVRTYFEDSVAPIVKGAGLQQNLCPLPPPASSVSELLKTWNAPPFPANEPCVAKNTALKKTPSRSLSIPVSLGSVRSPPSNASFPVPRISKAELNPVTRVILARSNQPGERKARGFITKIIPETRCLCGAKNRTITQILWK